MGNFGCCCSGSQSSSNTLKQQHLSNLVKIQSVCRTYLAKKKLRETRD